MSINNYKKWRRKIVRIILIVILILITISIPLFYIVEKNLEPALKEIARTYVRQIATLAINSAISENVLHVIDEFEEIYRVDKNDNGEILMLSYNRVYHAKLVTLATERANQILMELSKEPIAIPLGQALNSNILAQIGPDVPITLVPMGAARADITLEMKEAGINTVAIVSRMVVEADVRIVIPFSSDTALVQTEVPVSIDIIPGAIPYYYSHGGGDQKTNPPAFAPYISIPGEDNLYIVPDGDSQGRQNIAPTP